MLFQIMKKHKLFCQLFSFYIWTFIILSTLILEPHKIWFLKKNFTLITKHWHNFKRSKQDKIYTKVRCFHLNDVSHL
jgi:CRISPR/Cas system-associated exonuclease Cas4 (RecB family)